MVHISVIQLLKTEGTEHEQERIFGADLDVYPSYKEGDTLFLRHQTPYLEVDKLRLTQFVVVDVHHSLSQVSKTLLTGKTHISMEVYVRKVD